MVVILKPSAVIRLPATTKNSSSHPFSPLSSWLWSKERLDRKLAGSGINSFKPMCIQVASSSSSGRKWENKKKIIAGWCTLRSILHPWHRLRASTGTPDNWLNLYCSTVLNWLGPSQRGFNPLGLRRQFFCPMDLLMPQRDVLPCVCYYVLSLHYIFFSLF